MLSLGRKKVFIPGLSIWRDFISVMTCSSVSVSLWKTQFVHRCEQVQMLFLWGIYSKNFSPHVQIKEVLGEGEGERERKRERGRRCFTNILYQYSSWFDYVYSFIKFISEYFPWIPAVLTMLYSRFKDCKCGNVVFIHVHIYQKCSFLNVHVKYRTSLVNKKYCTEWMT